MGRITRFGLKISAQKAAQNDGGISRREQEPVFAPDGTPMNRKARRLRKRGKA